MDNAARARAAANTAAQARRRAAPGVRERDRGNDAAAKRQARRVADDDKRAKQAAAKKRQRESKTVTADATAQLNALRRAKYAAATKAAVAGTMPLDQAGIASALAPRQLTRTKHAVLAMMPQDAAALMKNVNDIARSADLCDTQSFATVHGATPTEQCAAMWMSADVAAKIAGKPSAQCVDPGWVHELASKLVALKGMLPPWTTAGSGPAVLIYPTPPFLRAAARANPRLHFDLQSIGQAVHVDQAPGCPVLTNFVVPSADRPWTVVYKVGEREVVDFCATHGAGTRAALEQRGRVPFSAPPDGSGDVALVFSSATPHFGTGGGCDAPQTSAVFFQGQGAGSHQSGQGTAAHKYYGGLLASGEQRDCNADGVVPLPDLVALAQTPAARGARPKDLLAAFT